MPPLVPSWSLLVTLLFSFDAILVTALHPPYNEEARANRFYPQFFKHAGSSGTEHNRDRDDKLFFTSNSDMPLLPRLEGYVATHGECVVKGLQNDE